MKQLKKNSKNLKGFPPKKSSMKSNFIILALILITLGVFFSKFSFWQAFCLYPFEQFFT